MWQLLGLVFATIHPAAYSYNSLHIVDLQEVICPGRKQYVDIKLNGPELSGANANFPHIVSFLRSSNQATNITFRLLQTGTTGLTPTSVGDTVTLAYLGGERRLTSAGVQEITAHWKNGRRMSARRRGGGSSGGSSRSRSSSSSRSRSSPAPRPSPPRRRSMNANSPAARRRGSSTMASGPRRRSTATSAPGAPASHNRFQTSSGSGYGYTSGSGMQSNYGGRYPQASPSYGYSGASSYGGGRPGSSYGTGTIVAAAVGGAVVGAGTYYMFSRLSRSRCDGYDCCYNCANSCYDRVRNCNPQSDRQLYRDDIMKSGQGFYPNDFLPPLYLRVSAISGEGYNTSSICPPSDWNESQPFPNISVANDLFVTLTKLEELADPGGDSAGVSAARLSQNLDIVTLGLAFAMLCVSMRFGR